MTRQIDADALIAMLRKESKEWATIATEDREGANYASRFQAAGVSIGYKAAAEDVEKMVKEQAVGSVPTDKVE